MILNKGQQEVLGELVKFLFDSNEKEIVVDSPAGYGKTTVIQHLVDAIQEE